jgi:hypothetical protein
MTRIAIDTAFDPIEVDLWGTLFETRSMPRSRARKARGIGLKIEALMKSEPADDETAEREEEELVGLYGELFDLKFAAADGGRRKPSTLLKQRWEDDKLTGEGLAAFVGKLTLAERQQMVKDISEFSADPSDRPT